MKVLIQRITEASVTIDNDICRLVGKGLLLFVGFTYDDNINTINKMIDKIIHLRIFDDENGVMNKSVIDIKGEILSISQFTLYADATKGRRPSYVKALNGDEASKLYELFNKELIKKIPIETGKFGSYMKVSLVNDGPITIMLESEN